MCSVESRREGRTRRCITKHQLVSQASGGKSRPAAACVSPPPPPLRAQTCQASGMPEKLAGDNDAVISGGSSLASFPSFLNRSFPLPSFLPSAVEWIVGYFAAAAVRAAEEAVAFTPVFLPRIASLLGTCGADGRRAASAGRNRCAARGVGFFHRWTPLASWDMFP